MLLLSVQRNYIVKFRMFYAKRNEKNYKLTTFKKIKGQFQVIVDVFSFSYILLFFTSYVILMLCDLLRFLITIKKEKRIAVRFAPVYSHLLHYVEKF